MNAKTACIIVNYNDSERTLKLLDHIKDYDSVDYLIVVDNCSTDESFENLSKFKHLKYFLLKSPRNGGYGFGNNCGAKKARELGSDYILIANPDVWFSNECVAHMKQTMISYPCCAIVGAKEVRVGSWAWRYTSGLHDVLSASLIFNKILKKRYYSKEYFENKSIAEVEIIPGCLLLVDLLKFLEVGGYDENVFLYEEEKILYCRMREKYTSIVDLSVEYEHNHEESHSYSLRSCIVGKQRLIRSRYYFLKNYRKINSLELFLSRFFFQMTILEMFVWTFVRRLIVK